MTLDFLRRGLSPGPRDQPRREGELIPLERRTSDRKVPSLSNLENSTNYLLFISDLLGG